VTQAIWIVRLQRRRLQRRFAHCRGSLSQTFLDFRLGVDSWLWRQTLFLECVQQPGEQEQILPLLQQNWLMVGLLECPCRIATALCSRTVCGSFDLRMEEQIFARKVDQLAVGYLSFDLATQKHLRVKTLQLQRFLLALEVAKVSWRRFVRPIC
jgi:hypothetical protein